MGGADLARVAPGFHSLPFLEGSPVKFPGPAWSPTENLQQDAGTVNRWACDAWVCTSAKFTRDKNSEVISGISLTKCHYLSP